MGCFPEQPSRCWVTQSGSAGEFVHCGVSLDHERELTDTCLLFPSLDFGEVWFLFGNLSGDFHVLRDHVCWEPAVFLWSLSLSSRWVGVIYVIAPASSFVLFLNLFLTLTTLSLYLPSRFQSLYPCLRLCFPEDVS